MLVYKFLLKNGILDSNYEEKHLTRIEMLWNGNECRKTKVIKISRQQSSVQFVIDKKQMDHVGYFNYLQSTITSVARCTCKISRQQSSVQFVIDNKQTDHVGYFNYLQSIITSVARCTCKIKSRIAMVKAVFDKKKTLFTSKRLKFKEELVKC